MPPKAVATFLPRAPRILKSLFLSQLVPLQKNLNTPVKALSLHDTQFNFSDVQPASVLGRVAEFNTADVLARLGRRERFVERPFGVRVQIVADQRDPLDAGVTRIE